jgi:cation transport ATPase
MSRLADRLAMVFLGVTVALAGCAWLWTGEPIRALAVLVVATPCPLILAVPVAIISGVSRAAKLGILIKGGRALENLARVRTLVIDKTGTLTYGAARLVTAEVTPEFSPDDILGLAASLDQASNHVIAQALVSAARAKGCALTPPDKVSETAGEGIEGVVAGRRVVVGGVRFVSERSAGPSTKLATVKSPSHPGRCWSQSRSRAGSRVASCSRMSFGQEQRSFCRTCAPLGYSGSYWRRVTAQRSPTPSQRDCRSTRCARI